MLNIIIKVVQRKKRKMKKRIVISLICGILLVSCSQKIVNNDSDISISQKSNEEKHLKEITYSNLVDKASQEEVRTALKNAGVSEKSIKSFFEGVNYFNNSVENVSLVKNGFKIMEKPSPVYDEVTIQEKWNKKNPKFIGQNCRITAFELMKDFVSVGNPEIKNTEQLFMDQDSLKNFPVKIFTDKEKQQFESLFSSIETENTKDFATHIRKVKEDWEKKNIKFSNKNKISMISVFFHSEITPKESFLFIGHVGVLVPSSDGRFLFIEKLAFQEPYQALKFDNVLQLNDYLLNKYDVEYGQPNARPFIMENGDPLLMYHP